MRVAEGGCGRRRRARQPEMGRGAGVSGIGEPRERVGAGERRRAGAAMVARVRATRGTTGNAMKAGERAGGEGGGS